MLYNTTQNMNLHRIHRRKTNGSKNSHITFGSQLVFMKVTLWCENAIWAVVTFQVLGIMS